jgi:hypothetical protein
MEKPLGRGWPERPWPQRIGHESRRPRQPLDKPGSAANRPVTGVRSSEITGQRSPGPNSAPSIGCPLVLAAMSLDAGRAQLDCNENVTIRSGAPRRAETELMWLYGRTLFRTQAPVKGMDGVTEEKVPVNRYRGRVRPIS